MFRDPESKDHVSSRTKSSLAWPKLRHGKITDVGRQMGQRGQQWERVSGQL